MSFRRDTVWMLLETQTRSCMKNKENTILIICRSASFFLIHINPRNFIAASHLQGVTDLGTCAPGPAYRSTTFAAWILEDTLKDLANSAKECSHGTPGGEVDKDGLTILTSFWSLWGRQWDRFNTTLSRKTRNMGWGKTRSTTMDGREAKGWARCL